MQKKLLALTAFLGLAMGLGLWQRDALLGWWHVRQLAATDEAGRDDIVARLLVLHDPSGWVLDQLRSADDRTATNLQAGLVALAREWGVGDARGQQLASQLQRRFDSMPSAGKAASLRAASALLSGKAAPSADVVQSLSELLSAAERDSALTTPTLALAGEMADRIPPGQCLDMFRDLALRGLKSSEADARVAAIHLVLREPIRKQDDLIRKLVPLLKDSDAMVRKGAVLALSPRPQLMGEDDLLPLLHDTDAEVQMVAELALRSRGLDDAHIELARLVSDQRPQARLQVLHYLHRTGDLDANIWLRRLMADPAPAVRAAAVRASSKQAGDFADRLRELSRQDPSPTVRQLASIYLQEPATKAQTLISMWRVLRNRRVDGDAPVFRLGSCCEAVHAGILWPGKSTDTRNSACGAGRDDFEQQLRTCADRKVART
ncbi:MAG: HEAT repeat domain-containing protein [Gemmataceae bacterium]